MCSKRTQSVLDLDRSIATLQADDANRFVCRTWQPSEHNAYTELAHTTRAGRAVLPADQLLPCDCILLDGELLVIADVRVTELMVILAFENLDWGRSVHRRRMVRLA
jgi:hypothetical protein